MVSLSDESVVENIPTPVKDIEKIKKKKEKKHKKEKKSKSEIVESVPEPSQTTEEKKKKKKDKKRKLEQVSVEIEADAVEKKSKKDTCSVWTFKESSHDKSTIESFLKQGEAQVTDLSGAEFPVQPVLNFPDAQFPSSLHEKLAQFPKPTVIQSLSWPIVLRGHDLVGISATGSGKTLAFGVPALIHILNHRAASSHSFSGKSKSPQVLILSPTRELAMQIQDQLVTFGQVLGITSIVIYGGVPKHEQKTLLRKGTDIIVATPGRLIDLFEEDSKVCDLSRVEYLVLDEADRMLDCGFEEAIKKIIARLPPKPDSFSAGQRHGRQTVMFSATWPTSIQKMAMSYLTSPIKITVGSTDLSANHRIEQRVEVIDPYGKESRLLHLLKSYHSSRKNRVLIFALYKKEAARLESVLKRNGYNVAAIHGDLSQGQRTAAIQGFKSGTCPLLIATDVAARGIDIPNVEYVINVTFPLTVEDYCHRIGRTGRAGKTGISHTFFTIHDKAHSGALINVLKEAGQPVPDELFKFGTTVKKKVDPNYGAFYKEVDKSVKPTKIVFD